MDPWVGQPRKRKSSRWFTTADKARTAFEQEIAWFEDSALKPVLAWVYLVQDGLVTDQRFIMQEPEANYQ
jgi:hypothetical protein